jgi:dipeptidyl aminopeptidase/acylaminoacyl peptidase
MSLFECNLEAQNYAEKPALDTSLFDKWPFVSSGMLSNDGKYGSYRITFQTGIKEILVFQQIEGSWKMEFANAGEPVFEENSNKVFFQISGDTLCALTFGSSEIKYIPHVSSFKIFKQNKTQWLLYRATRPEKELRLKDLSTGKEKVFSDVDEYLLGGSGNVLAFKTESKEDPVIKHSIKWFDLASGIDKIIWEGKDANNLILDDAASQLAFIVETKIDSAIDKSIWLYKRGADKAVLTVPQGMTDDLKLLSLSKFSKDGKKLFVNLEPKAAPEKPDPNKVSLDVWSYRDAEIQSIQLATLTGPDNYLAVIGMAENRLIRLQESGESLTLVSDNVVVVDHGIHGDINERNWSTGAQPVCFLIYTGTGERKPLDWIKPYFLDISRDGDYLINYNPYDIELSTYQISTGKTTNINQSIPVRESRSEYSLRLSRQIFFAGWCSGTQKMLVYDKYDLWEVDLSGRTLPVNLTKGHGRTHNTELRLVEESKYMSGEKTFQEGEESLLHSFDFTTKQEGFYRLGIGHNYPEAYGVGSYEYNDYNSVYDTSPFVRARDSEVYLVKRGRASESPNYFWTTDLKEFHPLSDVYPEKSYNWLRSELVAFNTIDDSINQGIIYKPENFDSLKKYPVIINYYQQRSDMLNRFWTPAFADGDVFSIPWFVSHGYVVFIPDIHYRMGENGKSALSAVAGAANYLSNLSYVDSLHIGIEGHSFAGFETNYIVTHIGRFAAAISSCGTSDLISAYGNPHALWAEYFENRQGRMGATPWETPDNYVKESPIFYADKVTTPLLMLANKVDGNVSFSQGLELFLGLRRMGKKAWMLQYDGESHGIGGRPFVDFTIRSQQFFDHYLKGAPTPKWMVEGIPAKMKQIDDGLELEPVGVEPGLGLLIPEEQKKVDALKNRKPITVTFEK